MRIKGVDVKEAPHIGWRQADPSRDKNLRGEPIPSNYVVFVYIKDCMLYEKDGRTYYNPENAPAIPVVHGGTYYAYGRERQSKRGYKTVPMYFCRDAYVYTGTIHKSDDQ